MKQFNTDELLKLLADTESERVERKERLSNDVKSRVREAVCAFANDLPNYNEPGVLFIGARDNGEPSNIEITDELLCSLSDIRTDGNILPPPVISVQKENLKNAEMAVVTVWPSDMPPVRYKGRICIRTGPRKATANAQEERILNEKRRYKDLPFDIRPCPTAKLSDLSRSVFENEYLPRAFADDVLEANERSYEERLASCKMIVSPTDSTPTLLGILAIGKSPQDFIPGAVIQFLKIDGIELADPVIDAETISGTLVDLLRRLEEKIKAHNRKSVDVTSSATHRVASPYPLPAIQQLIYNAVLHRTYEGTNAPVRVYWFNDRIEITSPGGPYGNVTKENFGEPGITDYRNPNIGDVLKTFGYIQAFGRGIAIARREIDKNGNPKPEFEVTQSAVQWTIKEKL